MMCPYLFDFYGSGFGWLAMILMIIWWAIIIVLAVVFIKWLIRLEARKEEKSATEILKERYAKGEIDKKEFEEKLKELK